MLEATFRYSLSGSPTLLSVSENVASLLGYVVRHRHHAETLSRLFNAFEQADNSSSGRYGGTALGLAMTAKAFAGDRDRCLAAGMNDFVTKPVTQEQLHTLILKWLETP